VEPRLKQRLVGASVLVALAVIFLPELLRAPEDGAVSPVDLAIPLAPQPSAELELPPAPPPAPASSNVTPAPRVAAPAVTAAGSTEEPAAAEPEEPVTSEPEPPAGRDTGPAPQAAPMEVTPDLAGWVVQVGSFSNPENAERLKARLRDGGFRAFTEDVKANGRSWRRVRVGPELSRAEAEQLQADIKARYGIQGLVRQHP
jgi:DedD protein